MNTRGILDEIDKTFDKYYCNTFNCIVYMDILFSAIPNG